MEATIVGNPVPDVTWTKNGQPLQSDHRVVLTCDGKKVWYSSYYWITVTNNLEKVKFSW